MQPPVYHDPLVKSPYAFNIPVSAFGSFPHWMSQDKLDVRWSLECFSQPRNPIAADTPICTNSHQLHTAPLGDTAKQRAE